MSDTNLIVVLLGCLVFTIVTTVALMMVFNRLEDPFMAECAAKGGVAVVGMHGVSVCVKEIQ